MEELIDDIYETEKVIGSRIKDLTGQRFGRLIVTAFIDRQGRNTNWNCLCDCGNTKIVSTSHLKAGNIKSCGCYKKEVRKRQGRDCKGKSIKRGSIGEGISSFNGLYTSYRCNAKRRNLSFLITKEEFKSLTQQNCFYCGVGPTQKYTSTWVVTSYGSYFYNGIDRIDSLKGYELANVVPSCGICNKAKFRMTQQEFYNWIDKVHEHIHKENLNVGG